MTGALPLTDRDVIAERARKLDRPWSDASYGLAALARGLAWVPPPAQAVRAEAKRRRRGQKRLNNLRAG